MKIQNTVLLFLMLLLSVGCSNGSGISQVNLSDPDVGISGNVSVDRDGTFSGEVKNGDVIAILNGEVVASGDDTHKVTISYERKTYTSGTTFKSEKINCELFAQSGVDVPIGKPPASNQSSGDDNSLERLSIKLIERDVN